MLKKDRPEVKSKLDAMNKVENLANEVISVVNDEKKIPMRKRATIGNRMVNHAINCYEHIRVANFSIPETDDEKKERLKFERLAEIECLNLCTDIRLLPTAVNCDASTKWFKQLQQNAVECKNIIHKWYTSDKKRYGTN